MTEENTPLTIESIRDEMKAQYDSLKTEFDNAIKTKDEEIANLKTLNTELNKALIKSAFLPDTPQPQEPKSEEELYKETIDSIYERSKRFQQYLS